MEQCSLPQNNLHSNASAVVIAFGKKKELLYLTHILYDIARLHGPLHFYKENNEGIRVNYALKNPTIVPKVS